MQAYSITYVQAMEMTLPQILMLTHSANVNYKRGEKRYEAKRKAEEERKKQDERDPIIGQTGKRRSELTTDELLQNIGM